MESGGEAAEQVVRMSLDGIEFAARITGEGAKNIAVLLYSILKEENKTKGKARLTSMFRSGKELKVFTVRQKDLQKFTQEAKKYGVLYCVLADRKNKDPNAEVGIIARAEDAAKISRIVERFNLASVDTASIVSEAEANRDALQSSRSQEKSETEKLLHDFFGDGNKSKQPSKQERKRSADFFQKRTGKYRRSKNFSEKQGLFDEGASERPSVRKELRSIQKDRRGQNRGSQRRGRQNANGRQNPNSRQNSNRKRGGSFTQMPRQKSKNKSKSKIRGAR